MTTDFGNRLLAFRKAHNLSQAQIAELAPTNKSCVCRWEKGGPVRADIQERLENFMANYKKKGSNGVTSQKSNAKTSATNQEAEALRLGMAVVAVRKAEIKVEELKAAQEALDKAKEELEAAETALLSKID